MYVATRGVAYIEGGFPHLKWSSGENPLQVCSAAPILGISMNSQVDNQLTFTQIKTLAGEPVGSSYWNYNSFK